jgi:hypothetical protein
LAAAAIVCPPAGLAAGAIFGVGVAVRAVARGPTTDASPVLDALDAVESAAEAVTAYLRGPAKDATCSPAAWTLEKLEQAAASLVDRVVALLRRMRDRKEAAAARRDMDRAARAQQHTCGPEVFAEAEAAARVARSRRRIMMDAAAGGVSSALVRRSGSVSNSDDTARRATRSAAEMMVLILEAFVAEPRRPVWAKHHSAHQNITFLIQFLPNNSGILIISTGPRKIA